jgi:hypothetical protein
VKSPQRGPRKSYDVDNRWNYAVLTVKAAFKIQAALEDAVNNNRGLRDPRLTAAHYKRIKNTQSDISWLSLDA